MSTETAPTTTPAVETTPVEKSTGNKLYIGNIEYRTSKSDLEELFKDYEIEAIEIPTSKVKARNQKGYSLRTKGYVFITFGEKHADELDAIIEKFTDFEFKDRKIYLRYPKPSSPKPEVEKKTEGSETNGEAKPKAEKIPKAKKPSAKKPVKKEKIPFDQGEKSTDTLYLKNLDFSVKSKDIKEFFEAEGETPKWASVPFNKLPGWILKKKEAAGENLERRNKGYAFVTLTLKDGETIDDKVEKFNNKKFNDRELLVSVAIDVRNAKTAETETETEEKAEEKADVEA